MNEVGNRLRGADPLTSEGSASGLAPDDAQGMRRAMLEALREPRTAAALWPHPLAVAATIALTLASGAMLGRHLPSPRQGASDAVARAGDAPALRQLQFATRGGTRVIWVFNQDFNP